MTSYRDTIQSCCIDPGGRVDFDTLVIHLRAWVVASSQSSSTDLMYHAWMTPKIHSPGRSPVIDVILQLNPIDKVEGQSGLHRRVADLPQSVSKIT